MRMRQKPNWLKIKLPSGGKLESVRGLLADNCLHTVCQSAACPNLGDCFCRGTATFLIMGNVCTRNCRFCNIENGEPEPLDSSEPERVAEAVKILGLKHTVITSVTRDDLPDGGATHFHNCINEVRRHCPDVKFEILTPDFRDCQEQAIEILRDALPFTFAHNIETVPSLYPIARAGGSYRQSLNLLRIAKEKYANIQTKSSIMLGLGEIDAEVKAVLVDLRDAGCDRITIGQYLKPSRNSLEVVEYITPEKFTRWKHKAIELGFSWVISSPFARSSYSAGQESPI